MITVKDILKLEPSNKKLAVSCFEKEYIIKHLEYVDYAQPYYSNSEGLELILGEEENCDTVKDLLELIKEKKLDEKEELISWDLDDMSMLQFNEILEYKDFILFV